MAFKLLRNILKVPIINDIPWLKSTKPIIYHVYAYIDDRRHFNMNEQDHFHAQLRSAWKQFYYLWARSTIYPNECNSNKTNGCFGEHRDCIVLSCVVYQH